MSERRTLDARRVTLGYGQRVVFHELSVEIQPGKITAIVGANACGKSTLLRALARLIKPSVGTVLLDGRDIHRLPTREVARRLGILPQSPIAPSGISVTDLVARGRYPHQGRVHQWTRADESAVATAMEATGILDLAAVSVDQLSGGQRQRVWIAMALAQETQILLLDEPTTFLDLANQIDVLDLLVDLNDLQERTIVMVLHDLNHAARYAHHLIALRDGSVCAQGPPAEVLTPDLVADIFRIASKVVLDPVSLTPMIVPIGRHARAGLKDASRSTDCSERAAPDQS